VSQTPDPLAGQKSARSAIGKMLRLFRRDFQYL
jgi:hypothetical protein